MPQRDIKVHAVLTLSTGIVHGPFGEAHALADTIPGYEGIMTIGLAIQADAIKQKLGKIGQKAEKAAKPFRPKRGFLNTLRGGYTKKEWAKFSNAIRELTIKVNWPEDLVP